MLKDFGKTVSIDDMEFRQINLSDEIWMKDNVDVSKVFSDNVDMIGLSRIMYRLLVDKSVCARKVFKSFDESGIEIEEIVGGVDRFRSKFHGEKGKLDLLVSFSELLRMSRPEPTEEATPGKK